MRRLLLLAVSVVSLAVPTAVPAGHEHGAGHRTVAYEAPLPCAALCPYVLPWLVDEPEEGFERACAREPDVNPLSYDEIHVIVPELVEGLPPKTLVGWIIPAVDYDLFLCRVVAEGTADERWGFVDVDWSLDGHDCDFIARCEHVFGRDVAPGQHYVLRAYNVSDGPSARGTISWRH